MFHDLSAMKFLGIPSTDDLKEFQVETQTVFHSAGNHYCQMIENVVVQKDGSKAFASNFHMLNAKAQKTALPLPRAVFTSNSE